MSQNPKDFQKPQTVTTKTSKTSRIPGSDRVRTESRTTITQVKSCPKKKEGTKPEYGLQAAGRVSQTGICRAVCSTQHPSIQETAQTPFAQPIPVKDFRTSVGQGIPRVSGMTGPRTAAAVRSRIPPDSVSFATPAGQRIPQMSSIPGPRTVVAKSRPIPAVTQAPIGQGIPQVSSISAPKTAARSRLPPESDLQLGPRSERGQPPSMASASQRIPQVSRLAVPRGGPSGGAVQTPAGQGIPQFTSTPAPKRVCPPCGQSGQQVAGRIPTGLPKATSTPFPREGATAKGIPRPQGRPLAESSQIQKSTSGLPARQPVGQVAPGTVAKTSLAVGPRPSKSKRPMDEEIFDELMSESKKKPESKVTAKGKKTTKICRPEIIETPIGREKVLQKAVFEERVERDEGGERIVKNVALSDLNEERGTVDKVQLGIQQFDPHYQRPEGREVIGVTSTVSITATYKTVSKECTRVSTEPLTTMSPAEVAQLVEEEKEDVENTLKMVPPDLVLEPGKYEIKQRLHKLRLNSESMALLEQSIIQPEPSADEAQIEPTPEAMATMMHTVEIGISPQSAPVQVFNSLFTETANEQFVKLSSITPGPLQDVVVATQVPTEVHKEMLSENMTKLAEKLNSRSSPEVPYVDIFTRVMDDMKKSPKKGKNKPRTFQPISDEKSLWVNAKLEHLVNVIGAEPADVLDPYNLEELQKSGKLEQEMANGIDYFVEADPIQYMSRVQLRGTQMPSYFPGYMVALPDFPGIVQIARSPDEVYASAWKAVQPKYFSDDSMHTLSF